MEMDIIQPPHNEKCMFFNINIENRIKLKPQDFWLFKTGGARWATPGGKMGQSYKKLLFISNA